MNTTPLVGEASSLDGTDTSPSCEKRERTPWLLAFLCLLIPMLPSYSVLAGPLKSNGSPAKLIAVLLFCLLLLGFAVRRRTTGYVTLRTGVVLIGLYLILILTIEGVGLSHLDNGTVEAGKIRA